MGADSGSVAMDEEFGGGQSDDGAEGRHVRKVQNPGVPTAEEKENHEMAGHVPYRSWCEHCVKGEAKELGHRKGAEVPEMTEACMLRARSQSVRDGLT